ATTYVDKFLRRVDDLAGPGIKLFPFLPGHVTKVDQISHCGPFLSLCPYSSYCITKAPFSSSATPRFPSAKTHDFFAVCHANSVALAAGHGEICCLVGGKPKCIMFGILFYIAFWDFCWKWGMPGVREAAGTESAPCCCPCARCMVWEH